MSYTQPYSSTGGSNGLSASRLSSLTKPLHDRIEVLFEKLEQSLPRALTRTHAFQTKLDHVGDNIYHLLAPLANFNEWLNEVPRGHLADKIILSIAKLPLKAARNLLVTLYVVIKEILSFLVHPLDHIHYYAHRLIDMIEALIDPSTWSNLGSGMMGTAVGMLMIPGNPLSVGLMVTSAIFMAFGLIGGFVKALQNMHYYGISLTSALEQYVLPQLQAIPEAFTTGLLSGVLLGVITRAHTVTRVIKPTQAEINQVGYQFVEDYHWAFGNDHWRSFSLDPSGRVIVWKHYYEGLITPTYSREVVRTVSEMGRYTLLPKVVMIPAQASTSGVALTTAVTQSATTNSN